MYYCYVIEIWSSSYIVYDEKISFFHYNFIKYYNLMKKNNNKGNN